jgi:hypothetical protein
MRAGGTMVGSGNRDAHRRRGAGRGPAHRAGRRSRIPHGLVLRRTGIAAASSAPDGSRAGHHGRPQRSLGPSQPKPAPEWLLRRHAVQRSGTRCQNQRLSRDSRGRRAGSARQQASWRWSAISAQQAGLDRKDLRDSDRSGPSCLRMIQIRTFLDCVLEYL